MTVDFKTFRACAPHVIAVRKPILIRGRHGVGKSEVVYQIAEDMGLPVVERRASQMTEGDLLGMPSPEMVEVNGERASVFRPFSWFLRACTEAVCLFIDELDRATTEVRQGFFELTDSRKLAGWHLHPDTIIMVAVNGGEHGAGGFKVRDIVEHCDCLNGDPGVLLVASDGWLGWLRTDEIKILDTSNNLI